MLHEISCVWGYQGISCIMEYLTLFELVWFPTCFFWEPLEQLGAENGSGRSAVHGMVNCRYWRSSARIRVRSALRFLPWKLQKASGALLRHWIAESCGKALGHARTKAKIVIVTNYDQFTLCTLHFAGVLAECFALHDGKCLLTLRLLVVVFGLCQLRRRFWDCFCSCFFGHTCAHVLRITYQIVSNRQILAYTIYWPLFRQTSGQSFPFSFLSVAYWTYETTKPTLAPKSGSNRCGAAKGLQCTAQMVTEQEKRKGPKAERPHRVEADFDLSALNLGTLNSYKSKPKSSLDVWIEFGKIEWNESGDFTLWQWFQKISEDKMRHWHSDSFRYFCCSA